MVPIKILENLTGNSINFYKLQRGKNFSGFP